MVPDSGCTEGEITPVVIRDAAFPFDYIDEAQFRSCLNATTARDNLASITQAVDSLEFLRIVLDKLREVGDLAGCWLVSLPRRQWNG